MLAKGVNWRLSPAFDLPPTPQIAADYRYLALRCGQFGGHANRDNLLSECGRFLLTEEEARSVFDDIVNTVRDQWHPTMRRAGVSETDCEKIRRAFLYEGLFYRSTD